MTSHNERWMGILPVMNADFHAPSLVPISWEDGAWRAVRRLTSSRVILSATIMYDNGYVRSAQSCLHNIDHRLLVEVKKAASGNASASVSTVLIDSRITSAKMGCWGSMIHDPSHSLVGLRRRWLLRSSLTNICPLPLSSRRHPLER
jgi:hypothetical protein